MIKIKDSDNYFNSLLCRKCEKSYFCDEKTKLCSRCLRVHNHNLRIHDLDDVMKKKSSHSSIKLIMPTR